MEFIAARTPKAKNASTMAEKKGALELHAVAWCIGSFHIDYKMRMVVRCRMCLWCVEPW